MAKFMRCGPICQEFVLRPTQINDEPDSFDTIPDYVTPRHWTSAAAPRTKLIGFLYHNARSGQWQLTINSRN
ncbi:hypothetical protein NBRC116495_15720 [Aurantivibrio plasticivorans]